MSYAVCCFFGVCTKVPHICGRRRKIMKQRTARKMHRFISMLMAVVLCAGLCGSFLAIKANAADGTVKGKVADGTTDDLLKLDTSEGVMQIKMDADLNIEDAPVLIKGKEVTVEWKYGSDSYLHTSCIKASGGTNWGATVDTTNQITVSGKVMEGSDASTLLLDCNGSKFNIRLDKASNFPGCRIIRKDKQLSVTVAGASDGYLHAVNITANETASSSSTITGVPEKTPDGRTLAVISGTVQDNPSDSSFVLKVNNNLLTIKIDSSTDLTQLHVLNSGRTVSAAVYTGSDNQFHAYKLGGNITNGPVALDGAAVTVSGTVLKNTDDNTLLLSTSDGNMTIRMDTQTVIGAGGLLLIGKKVEVVVQHGADAYMHAVKITGKESSSTTDPSSNLWPATTRCSGEVDVKGKVDKKTDNNTLYLNIDGQGTMIIRIDVNTKWEAAQAFRIGDTVKAKVYGGADAYMHAASITSNLDSASGTSLDATSQLNFVGKITKIDGSKITLSTASGDMLIKYDNGTNFDGYRILKTSDSNVTITAMTGSDGYWRATRVYK